MKVFKIRKILVLSVCLTPLFAYSQQTYQLQHNNIQPKKTINKSTGQQDTNVFVGCIEYSVSYLVVPTEDVERRNKAQFAATENKKSYGDERTICYNANGDWLHIYGNAEIVDRIWYFADSNEEYTFFKTGILKFTLNDTPEPDGLTGLAIKEFTRTDETKEILGFDTVKVTAEKESGILYKYWVGEKLVRNPASYKNNKFGYADKLYGAVRGIPLREETNVSDFLITAREAVEIQEGEPNEELFKLPAVDLYRW